MPFESALHRSRRPLQRTRPAPDRRLCKPRADPDTHPGPAGARGDRRGAGDRGCSQQICGSEVRIGCSTLPVAPNTRQARVAQGSLSSVWRCSAAQSRPADDAFPLASSGESAC